MRQTAFIGWYRGGQEGRPGRTRALSWRTHFESKSDVKMDARGRDQTMLSVWITRWDDISLFSYPHERVRTHGDRMSRLEMPLGHGAHAHTNPLPALVRAYLVYCLPSMLACYPLFACHRCLL
jgi:hypothetical protein